MLCYCYNLALTSQNSRGNVGTFFAPEDRGKSGGKMNDEREKVMRGTSSMSNSAALPNYVFGQILNGSASYIVRDLGGKFIRG